ncbi:VOC family protein [Halobacillus sp. B23F22_1]|uniref:VOC family protein n=1 Tax=Halobacillus sp. B23F22_1 TaxID=3459514 RepID=UPI00373F5A7F
MNLSLSKISPNLWFEDQAEQAAQFYVSTFSNSRILNVAYYGDAGPGPAGSVMTVSFEIEGTSFIALNGGAHFSFTPAISFLVDCDTQEEIDELWEKLSKDGEEVECGWLTDQFGVSWQIVPKLLRERLNDPDPIKAHQVMNAMLQMKKLEIKELEKAYHQ